MVFFVCFLFWLNFHRGLNSELVKKALLSDRDLYSTAVTVVVL